MEQTTLDTLTRPFDPAQIRQREGRGGKTLDYLETHVVVARPNEAFTGQWSFEVLSHEVTETEAIVHGRLTAGGVTKTAFGGSDIARHRETQKPVSIADDLKAAASDSLKKAATLFGIGLQLYAEKGQRPAQTRPTPQADRRPGPGQTTQQRPVSVNGRTYTQR
ncbi:MAG: hypothetical protein EXS64_08245 [Candidatus Latescibacteria bacterium]|nr:hypothetical protein [Candidatus Latescibacterota bacterium]